ncbi:hypothetical protein [Streptomyces sp. NPDC096153]|uniref:hypothetical protein n=1 Tax=Streptomyces sp. NPDC096153 TaxID=3155548 RepID=UPI00331C627F
MALERASGAFAPASGAVAAAARAVAFLAADRAGSYAGSPDAPPVRSAGSSAG